MATDHQAEIEALRKTFQQISSVSNPEGLRKRIAELTEASADPDLWDDQDKAQAVTSKLSHAQAELDKINAMSSALDDLEALKEMADEEAGSDPETAAELYSDLERELGQVARSQDDAAVCVRQAEEIVGSQARLDVFEGDVVDFLAPAEGVAHVFEHLQGGGANVDL